MTSWPSSWPNLHHSNQSCFCSGLTVFFEKFIKRLVCVPRSPKNKKRAIFKINAFPILNPVLIFNREPTRGKKRNSRLKKKQRGVLSRKVFRQISIGLAVTISYHYIIDKNNISFMTVHSKSFLANRWHQNDKEWAIQLVGLRMRVQGS